MVCSGAPEAVGILIGSEVLKLTEDELPSVFTGKPSKCCPAELTIKLSSFNLNCPALVYENSKLSNSGTTAKKPLPVMAKSKAFSVN